MQKFASEFWCWSEEQEAHDGDIDDFLRKVFGTDVLQDLYNLTQYTALWLYDIVSVYFCQVWHVAW